MKESMEIKKKQKLDKSEMKNNDVIDDSNINLLPKVKRSLFW